MEYLKIEVESREEYKYSFFERVMFFIFGRTNPDYDRKIGVVNYWLLEFESKDSYPVREIGLSPQGEVIMKMPYKKNDGYWVDNDIDYPYFIEHFPNEEITGEYFESQWEKI